MDDNNRRILHLLEYLIDSQSTPEAVCVESPDLLVEVREQWALCQQIDAKINALFAPADDSYSGDPTARSPVGEELPHIPGYEMRSILGRGGVGVVYCARHLRLDRLVAVKMLLAGPFASAVEHRTLLREAQAVARLRHPNIVQIYDIGDFDGRPFFTMELIEGKTLAQEIGGVPRPAFRTAQLMLALATATHFAHDAGIIHRDLKPSNVLIASDGTPKITDFGLARSVSREHSLTLEQRGTPSYMAPEHCTGAGSAEPTVDVYALGAILYEMLTGRPPFRGESAAETHRQLLTQEPVAPSCLNKPVPRDLETICLKCLQKDRRRRYGSAGELAEDLRRHAAGEPIIARRTRRTERAAKWVWRHPAVSTATVSGMLMMLGCFAISVWVASQSAARSRAVSDQLNEAVAWQQQSNWQAANTALDRAAVRLGDHGSRDLQLRLGQTRADSEFAAHLDAIAAQSLYSTSGLQNFGQSDREYHDAFAKAGISADSQSPDAVAEKIRASHISGRLVLALYEWSFVTNDTRRAQLWNVLCQADHDPTGTRERLRIATVWEAPQALAKAAEDLPIARQPVPFCMAMCHQMERLGLDTLAFLTRLQDAHPQDFWANLCLANALLERGKLPDATRFYQAAIAIRPDAGIARHNLGLAFAHAGRHAEAVEQYSRALQIDSGTFVSRFGLADEYFAMNRRAEAIAPLRQCLRHDPHNVEVMRLLGAALDATGDLEGACQQFQEAIRLAPARLELQSLYRNTLFKMGRNDEAFTVWQKLIQLKPEDHDSWNGYAEFCLFCGRETDYRQARTELLNRFGASNDPHVCERVSRACLLLPPSEQELQKACDLIDRAIRIEKAKPTGYLRYYQVSKALADLRADDASAAVADLHGSPMHALGPAPGLILAMAQFNLGNTDEANGSLAKAISSFDWNDHSDLPDYWIYHILKVEAQRTQTGYFIVR